MNRREFLVRTGAAAAGGIVAGTLTPGALARAATESPRGVSLIADPADPVVAAAPSRWAVDQLREALTQRGVEVRLPARLAEAPRRDLCVIAAGALSPLLHDVDIVVPDAAESLAIAPARLGGRDVLVAAGRDVRGLVYALTELADAVANGAEPGSVLRPAHGTIEQPANEVRSIMRMVISEVEDKRWYHDRAFWQRYLSLLAGQRFNRFNLAFGLGYDRPSELTDTYFYFAYPFLVSVPGYDVRASGVSAAEREENLALLRFISDEAVARGLDFQLGVWTHAYQWHDSPQANHLIEGLTPATQAPYCRDALALVLKECPAISGVTFRIHGESGVPEGSYGLWRTVFDGLVRSGRRVRLDMHAKGMDQPTLDAALATGLPVTVSPKFWAEHLGLPYHQAAIRAEELPKREKGSGMYAQSEGARSFLRYGYGDLLREDRRYGILHRVWPGTQHLLLWGDPSFAAGYGRAMSFCGSLGGEFFDPLSFKGRQGSSVPNNGGRAGYADPSLEPVGGDFTKYTYTYRLLGRMLYRPASGSDVWQRQLRHEFGAAAIPAGAALAHASRILPLLTTASAPCASNYAYWPEMGVNMSLLDNPHPAPYGETKNPSRFGHASPLDPQLFIRPDEFGELLARNDTTAKYTPVEVAQTLEDWAAAAEAALTAATAKADLRSPAYRRLAVDTRIQFELARFYAQKLRAAVWLRLYECTGDRAPLARAVAAYRSARAAWARAAEAATGVYVRDLTFGAAPWQRGHWVDRLPGIDADIAKLERLMTSPITAPAGESPRHDWSRLDGEALSRPERPVVAARHEPPRGFRRGTDVELSLALASPAGAAVRLHYRHTHQAQSWQMAPMSAAAGAFRAAIPAAYTDSPFPLQYYFEITAAGARPTLFPGLGSDFSQQPYFVLRSI